MMLHPFSVCKLTEQTECELGSPITDDLQSKIDNKGGVSVIEVCNLVIQI